jgi:hypothetical protein
MNPWQALGVSPDIEVADLRRRYAALIKAFRPETHPQDFARIREAYEVALPMARRRAAEAQASEPASSERADIAVATMPGEAPPAPELEPESTLAAADEVALAEVVAPPAAPASREDDHAAEPALAAHFHRFHALAGSATGTDDEAFLPALRALLQARTQATLDDSQALEFALMRWFVESEKPPLTLLFETGRAFDWHRHVLRLSSWLSPWALRQMEARLALSRDLVHARHFSGNRRLRRLHETRTGPALLVMRPAAVEATAWVQRWRTASDAADAAALEACLNPVAVRQLHGLASTDLLVGLAVATFAADLSGAATWAVLATAVVLGLRRLLQAIGELPREHRVHRAMRVILGNLILVGVLSAVASAFGAIAFTSPEPNIGTITLGALLAAPAALFAIAGAWRIAAFLELVLAWPLQWREAVDRLEFDRFAHGSALPEAGRPFGSRLGLVQRLRAIRAALRLQAVEIATNERPPRPRPFTRLSRLRSTKTSKWRIAWFLAWIVFAIVRGMHAFGGGN